MDQQIAAAADLFQRALQVAPTERDAWLREQCGSDIRLHSDVLGLLTHHEQAGDFLDTPAVMVAESATPPDQIGDYRIDRILGQGGMGVVYEATQQNPRRPVALKVIRNPFAGTDMIRRFEHEADALARLNHPGIARIFEAGTADTDSGIQPFLAMELVEGLQLNEYVQKHGLSVRARVELLACIADAISHAHQKGVIHRDLKPANILVDDSGQPRVLDFGVARLTDVDLNATQQTHAGQVLGTLAYMSPEQARGDVEQLDTRSDVYTLGVLAYQLLSGALPIPLEGKNLPAATRAIEEHEPERLGRIDPRLRGDVETIVDKALRKDINERYASAADFAADLRRHLADQPILARPGGPLYQLQKFARRHTGFVVGAGLAVLTLLVAIVLTASAYVSADHERVSAERAVVFLGRMLRSTDATAMGADVRLVDVLDRAAEEVGIDFADRPQIEADLRGVLGEGYHHLDKFEQAAAQFAAQIELLQQEQPVQEDVLLRAEANHALALMNASQLDAAADMFARVLERQRTLLGQAHRDTISTLSNYSILLRNQGALDDALPVAREAYDASISAFGEDHLDTLGPLNNLASLLDELGQSGEAAEMYQRLIRACRAQLPDDDPRLMIAQSNYAGQLNELGRHEEAADAFAQLIETQQRLLPPLHRNYLLSRNNYAMALRDARRDDEAHDVLAELVEDIEELPDRAWPYRYSFQRNFALTLMDADAFAAAVEVLDQARIGAEEHLPAGHPVTSGVLELLGKALLLDGRPADAEPHCRAALAIMLRFLPESHPKPQKVLRDLADVLDALQRPDEADAVRARLLREEGE